MADDFSEKLSAILGNPEAMGQIMSIAQAIGGGGETPSEPGEAQAPEMVRTEPDFSGPPAMVEAPPAAASQMPDLSGILGMLGSLTGGGGGGSGGGNPLAALGDIDPRLIGAGMKLLSEMNRTDDRKTALLAALRPFVKEERYAKVDRAIQIARLSRVIRVALTLFKEGGGQEHV